MDAPVIEIGKHPVTLAKPRAIAAYAVQARPSIGVLLAMWGKHPRPEHAADEPEEQPVEPEGPPEGTEAQTDTDTDTDTDADTDAGADEDMHPELLAAMQCPDCTATRCAALAVCWPKGKAWPVKKRPRPWKMRQPIEEYGAEVFDNLLEGGILPGKVIAASWPALWWTLSSLPTDKDRKGARDFSEAPSGD